MYPARVPGPFTKSVTRSRALSAYTKTLSRPGHWVTRVRTVPAITHIIPGTVSPTRHTQLHSGHGIPTARRGNSAICTAKSSVAPRLAGIIPAAFQFI
jgi:hypothetical protein